MYKLLIALLLTISTTAYSQTVFVMQDNAKVPKKPGVVRIGIANPAADMGNDFTMEDTPMGIRNTLSVALTEDKVETVFLESALPDKEAKQKECDYIFYSKVTRKKGGGGMFGSMLPMLGVVGASMIPGVGGIVGSVAASTIMTATTISGGFKSKDEIGFEYSFTAADGTSIIPTTTSKLKAKKDGEDVLTPQIRQATVAALAKLPKPQQP